MNSCYKGDKMSIVKLCQGTNKVDNLNYYEAFVFA